MIGGLLLLLSQNRATAMLGGWLSVVAGAWFVIGRVMATTLTIGEIGRPVAGTDVKAAWLELTYFHGLGALIVFFGAIALGRVSVRSVRDVGHAQRVATARHDDEIDDDATAVTGPVDRQRRRSQVEGDQPDVEERPKRSWRDPAAAWRPRLEHCGSLSRSGHQSRRWVGQRSLRTRARMSMPSSSNSSLIVKGGRKRSTFP